MEYSSFSTPQPETLAIVDQRKRDDTLARIPIPSEVNHITIQVFKQILYPVERKLFGGTITLLL